ncbi:hypothetical protein ACM26V_16710 [Salipaludibacillus sp. HK11]|uniref:hypothetical protein n=1 Tax=Salipaludibacillus sp. HK11 TaxID=3394320 RepID=UPI0039FCE9BC
MRMGSYIVFSIAMLVLVILAVVGVASAASDLETNKVPHEHSKNVETVTREEEYEKEITDPYIKTALDPISKWTKEVQFGLIISLAEPEIRLSG